MANEKTYSAREAALAVLAKAQELLAKSSIAKKEEIAVEDLKKSAEYVSGMHKVEYFEPMNKADMLHDNVAQRRQERAKGYKAHGDHNSHKIAIEGAKESHKELLGQIKDQPKPNLPKSENPDEKQDAKLGEEVEGLCERHMKDNRAAERKEGHSIVKSEMCKMCKSMSKNEFSELYEDLAKMEKYEAENPKRENEIGTKFKKAENKDAPSNPMKPKIEEKPIERDNKNFETQPGKSNTPPDAREAPLPAPQAGTAEKNGNPQAGSVPGKGVHKLSFFMGHRHNKRNGQKPPVNG